MVDALGPTGADGMYSWNLKAAMSALRDNRDTNALLIGVFAGVINVVPYIGPVTGILFALFVGITTNLNLNFDKHHRHLGEERHKLRIKIQV